MKSALTSSFALIVLALFAFMPSHAAADAVGPYYATPSWDQTLPGSTRFVVLSNFNSQAVLDRETGLVWQRSPLVATADWYQASVECLGTNTGGRHGWRLPTATELSSLFDRNASAVQLPAGHPFIGVQIDHGYWTATTHDQFPNEAWTVDFALGDGMDPSQLDGVDKGTNSNPQYRWCVRGGIQTAPQ